MPGPREWPTIAADDRDKAAEFVNNGADRLSKVRRTVPAEYRVELAEAEIDLQRALRLLERHGARTTVPDPLPT